MQITDELIEKGKSRHGGWSRAQLALLGVSWPPRKGWRRKITGKVILPEVAARFMELRNAHKKPHPVDVNQALDREFDAIFQR